MHTSLFYILSRGACTPPWGTLCRYNAHDASAQGTVRCIQPCHMQSTAHAQGTPLSYTLRAFRHPGAMQVQGMMSCQTAHSQRATLPFHSTSECWAPGYIRAGALTAPTNLPKSHMIPSQSFSRQLWLADDAVVKIISSTADYRVRHAP